MSSDRRPCPRCAGSGMISSPMMSRPARGGVIRLAGTIHKCTLCGGDRVVDMLDTEQRRLASCYRSDGWGDEGIARMLGLTIEAVIADRLIAEGV